MFAWQRAHTCSIKEPTIAHDHSTYTASIAAIYTVALRKVPGWKQDIDKGKERQQQQQYFQRSVQGRIVLNINIPATLHA